MEVIFRRDPMIYDGSRANNGWLQETPKPITNLCWDNAVLISPQPGEEVEVWSPATSSKSTSMGAR